MKIAMIVAVADNGIIGKENGLPWHLGADMKRFKALTTGHTILMGKNTYLSIGRALPNRRNVILSHSLPEAEGCEIICSLEQLSSLGLKEDEELIIIGGASLYEQMLDKADTLYLTQVHTQAQGDVKMPAIAWEEWEKVSEESHQADERNDYDYSFVNYRRKK